MTAITICLSILYLLTVAGLLTLLWRQNESATNERIQADARARMERDSLLERIQRPEFRPVMPDLMPQEPAPEPFEEALVGMIVEPPASPEPENSE